MPRKGGGGIAAYNAVIAAIKSRTGVSHKEAQQTYRAASVRLGKPPSLTEARRGAAVKQEAARAGGQLKAKRAAELAKVERAIERARAPRRKDKGVVKIQYPKRGGGDRGGDRGGGGGGGAPAPAPAPGYDPDYVDLEPPDEFGGDDGDYVPD